MSEDLFSNENRAASGDPVPLFENEGSREPVVDPDKNWLEEYVGEGKKFKDVADLARGKAHSDVFISRLQREAEELRKELNTRIKLEEFMDRMNSQNSNGANQSTQTAGTGDQSNGTASTNATSPDDIENLIEQRLAQREADARARQNLEATRQKLKEAFGENFQGELESRTESLGLTKDFVANLAKTQPKALFALLGIDGQQKRNDDIFASPRGSINTSGLGSNQSSEKNWAYYERVRKQNPALYFSVQVQQEMHRQAAKLGERFYS